MRALFAGILFLFSLTAFARAQTPPATQPAPPATAEFRNGHWTTVAPPVAPAAPDPDLDHVQQLLTAHDPSAALDLGLYWIKTHGNHAPSRDRALFLIASAKYDIDGGNDRFYAFYYLDELLDEYPDGKLFYPALQKQYDIADGYLTGHKNKILGLPIVPADEEAIVMLYRIQQRSPGSALAERCLLRTADYYFRSREFELAHDAYGYYIKAYPRSPDVPRVKLRQAFSSLAQFRGVRFDPTSLLNARLELLDIQTAYPELAKEENVAGLIVRIDEALARKLYVTADFYRRTHAPRGAVYMYRYLLAMYPDAADAPAAKRALASMPKSALDQPGPTGSQYAPPGETTQPAAVQ